ncbi:MAG: 2-oxoacid:acceptor oxidoreductase family protein [Firmicutes bacterium]|nr:2-oxoacid:acceptor oxidoreductase family protein [Bacillota bacterium]
MHHEIVAAGYGGQGVLLAGQILACAGMLEGKHVSWYPSYGPEMRGGTCNCSVVISSETVGSPVVNAPSILIAMNDPSFRKFWSDLGPGGLVVSNSSLIKEDSWGPMPVEAGLSYLPVPASEEALALGEPKVANLVMVGAMAEATALVGFQALEDALGMILPPHRRHLVSLNMQAVERGRYHGAKGCRPMVRLNDQGF